MEIPTSYLTFLLNIFPSIVTSLNFYNIGKGKEPSYAEYQTGDWNILENNEASLELYFKTNMKYGILLHLFTRNQNTNEDNIVLHIELHDGILKSCFGTVCKYDDDTQLHKASLGSKWNDMVWHKVQIERLHSEIFINIGGIEAIVTVGENNEDDETNLSQPHLLHIGGTRNVIGSEIVGDVGFTGCIENVSYPIGTLRSHKWRSGDVGKNCMDNTCFKLKNDKCVGTNDNSKCQHISTNQVSCYCTSFFTPNCQDLSKASAYVDERTMVRDQLDVPFVNSRTNTIELRFRSRKSQGIIMYNRKSSSYILLELMNGCMELRFSVGAGEVQITAGENLHDGRWHAVTVKRSGKKVALDIDGRYHISKEFLYYPATSTCFSTPELLYLGGYIYPDHVKESRSKKNFDGCLQEVYIYNDVSRAEEEYEYISRAKTSQTYRSERSKVEGKLSKCTMKEIEKPFRDSLVTEPVSKATVKNASISRSKRHKRRSKLSEKTVAWITAGICIGSVAMIVTLGCGFHFMRKKYSGHFSTKKIDRNAAQQYMNSNNVLSESNTFSDLLKGPAAV